jgi:hypothetical protein
LFPQEQLPAMTPSFPEDLFADLFSPQAPPIPYGKDEHDELYNLLCGGSVESPTIPSGKDEHDEHDELYNQLCSGSVESPSMFDGLIDTPEQNML